MVSHNDPEGMAAIFREHVVDKNIESILFQFSIGNTFGGRPFGVI